MILGIIMIIVAIWLLNFAFAYISTDFDDVGEAIIRSLIVTA